MEFRDSKDNLHTQEATPNRKMIQPAVAMKGSCTKRILLSMSGKLYVECSLCVHHEVPEKVAQWVDGPARSDNEALVHKPDLVGMSAKLCVK